VAVKKFVCFDGFVVSQNDGDRHYISPQRVAELYHVNPADCVFLRWKSPGDIHGLDLNSLRRLFPRSDGKYDLEAA
jgi:hypothetical protein